jgi:hypothetical protein
MRRKLLYITILVLLSVSQSAAQSFDERKKAVIEACSLGTERRFQADFSAWVLRLFRLGVGGKIDVGMIDRTELSKLIQSLDLSQESKNLLIRLAFQCLEKNISYLNVSPAGLTNGQAPTAPQKLQFQITVDVPKDKSTVCTRPSVQGSIAEEIAKDVRGQVWIVVHPLEINDYFVQVPASVGGNHQWKALPYFGRPTLDAGKSFEFKAFAGPTQPLRKEMKLDDWPDAKWSSDLVAVTRGNC